MLTKTICRPGQIFTRIVLPLGLFVVVVAVLAWVIQYLPKSGGGGLKIEPPAAATQTLVKFDHQDKNHVQAQWDPKELVESVRGNDKLMEAVRANYVHEIEAEDTGYHDFPFQNVSGDLEAGLQGVGCDACTEASMIVYPAGTWTALGPFRDKRDPVTVSIADGARGSVRVGWTKNAKQSLKATIWLQPKGDRAGRQMQTLGVNLRIVPALRFFHAIAPEAAFTFANDKLEVGEFRGSRKGVFRCWSSTRDDAKLAVNQRAVDHGFEYKITPLSSTQRKELQGELIQAKVYSRVKSAYKIEVNVYEEKDGRFLDQGYFTSRVPLLLQDRGEEFAGPIVHGYLTPDVKIIGGSDDGRIDIGRFNASDGSKTKKSTISAEPMAILSVMRGADNTDVKLARKKPTESKWQWELDVRVPPNSFGFQGGVIVLRSVPLQPAMLHFAGMTPDFSQIAGPAVIAEAADNQTRKIRVPVLGTAVQR